MVVVTLVVVVVAVLVVVSALVVVAALAIRLEHFIFLNIASGGV